METGKYIRELLQEHDCVIIPGLGGFITTRQPAVIDGVTKTVAAPSKKVSFNKLLSTNDGLLASRIAERSGIGYADADRELSRFVKQCNKQLEEDGFVVFPEIGKLFVNNSGQLSFAPIQGRNLLADSFGLAPAHFAETYGQQPVVTQKEPVTTPAQKKKPTKTANLPQRSTGYWLQLAATLLVIAGLSVLMAKDVYVEQLTLQNLGFVNFGSAWTEDADVTPVLESTGQPAEVEEVHLAPELPVMTNEDVPMTSDLEKESGYYLVWGSFSNEGNAEKLIKRNKTMELEIMRSAEGYYRVVQYASTQSSQAKESLTYHRDKYQSSIWLLYNMH